MDFRARDRAGGWYESAHQGGQHRQVIGGQREGLANFLGKSWPKSKSWPRRRRGLQGLERGPIRWTEGCQGKGPSRPILPTDVRQSAMRASAQRRAVHRQQEVARRLGTLGDPARIFARNFPPESARSKSPNFYKAVSRQQTRLIF